MHNIKISGEAASADKEAAGEYPAIEKRGCTPQQVLTVHETGGLYWKRMPTTAFILFVCKDMSRRSYSLMVQHSTYLPNVNRMIINILSFPQGIF